MRLVVEISLYPLNQAYLKPIQSFIERLNGYEDLYVKTSATSTVVAGDNVRLMQILQEEMQVTHEEVGQAIFVCKFLNGTNMELD
ncbi:hypothetical protein ACFO4O_06710 [Glaciecola siphonariae]|uniref:Thiamin/hydroxymethyl pyrimidine-binding YkoF putative domain-containing protein n=1 Tax=Glaciecola siphonariae TaxID=521012 RepID=A0ABV9LVH8_9ALTE